MSVTTVPLVPLVTALESALSAVARAKFEQPVLHGVRLELNPDTDGGVLVSGTDRFRATWMRVVADERFAGDDEGTGAILVYRTAAATLLRALRCSDAYKAASRGGVDGVARVRLTEGRVVVFTRQDEGDAAVADAWHDVADYPQISRLFPDADTRMVEVTVWAEALARIAEALRILRGPSGEEDPTIGLNFQDEGAEHVVVTQTSRADEIALRLGTLGTPAELAGRAFWFNPSFLKAAIASTGASGNQLISLWFQPEPGPGRPVLFRCQHDDPRNEQHPGHLLVPIRR